LAHSLFEPAPEPITEKFWRRMKDFGFTAPHVSKETTADHTDPALLVQAGNLDARGRQQLLEAVLTTKPIKK